MTEPKNPQPSNRADLEPYTQALLLAAEVSDRLALRGPTAYDVYYQIADPRIMPLIDIPLELGVEPPEDLSLQFSSHVDQETGAVYRDAIVMIDFSDTVARISSADIQPNGMVQAHIISADANEPVRSPLISRQELSNIVSRAVRPNNDPLFSDYTDLTIPAPVNDIRMTLEGSEFVSSNEVTYHTIGNHTLVMSTENGRLTELAIGHPLGLGDDEGLVMRATSDVSRHSLEFFHAYTDSSREIPATRQEIEAFRDILIDIKDTLQQESQKDEMSLDIAEVNEGLL